jgi:hypothetical protein
MTQTADSALAVFPLTAPVGLGYATEGGFAESSLAADEDLIEIHRPAAYLAGTKMYIWHRSGPFGWVDSAVC